MTWNKALIVGSVLALLAGAAASTILASTEERPDVTPITVPVGHLGDRVVYAYFATDAAFETATDIFTPDSGPYRGSGMVATPTMAPPSHARDLYALGPRAWEVRETRSSGAAAGDVHRAVIIVHNETYAAMPALDLQIAEHVDTQVRQTFRRDSNVLLNDEGQELLRVTNAEFVGEDPSLPGIPYQGQTLTLGTVVEDRAAPEYDRDGIQGSHVRLTVAQRAFINGHDSYAVVREYSARGPVVASVFGMSGPTAQGGLDRIEVLIRLKQTTWMSADYAYATYQESAYELEHEGVVLPYAREAYVLQSVNVGGALIPWGPDGANVHFAQQRSDLERGTAPEGVHPAAGSGSSLKYPLDDAIRNVRDDLLLLQYRAWTQTHPYAIVVAASYGPGPQSSSVDPTVKWTLLFATTDGSAYAAGTEKTISTGVVRNADEGSGLGRTAIRAFQSSEFPANPPTLGELERTWSNYVSAEGRARPFNYLRWGVDFNSDPCVRSGEPSVKIGGPALDLVYEGGHSASSACVSTGDANSDSSRVAIDPDSGLVESVLEMRFRYQFNSLGIRLGAAALRLPQQEPATVPVGLVPPTPVETTATSAGFLAVFLAAYFWPTIKFLAVKAALLGGYAKIGRDEVLQSRPREQILELIKQNPGIHASELARQVNAGWGTIVYHLSVLERNKVVTSLMDGRHKRFFPADTVDFSKRGQLAALRNQTSKMIYQLIEAEPGAVQGLLAEKTGLTVPTVIWHLQRLEAAGLVGRDKEGRRFHYYANPAYEPKQPGAAGDGMEVA